MTPRTESNAMNENDLVNAIVLYDEDEEAGEAYIELVRENERLRHQIDHQKPQNVSPLWRWLQAIGRAS